MKLQQKILTYIAYGMIAFLFIVLICQNIKPNLIEGLDSPSPKDQKTDKKSDQKSKTKLSSTTLGDLEDVIEKTLSTEALSQMNAAPLMENIKLLEYGNLGGTQAYINKNVLKGTSLETQLTNINNDIKNLQVGLGMIKKSNGKPLKNSNNKKILDLIDAYIENIKLIGLNLITNNIGDSFGKDNSANAEFLPFYVKHYKDAMVILHDLKAYLNNDTTKNLFSMF